MKSIRKMCIFGLRGIIGAIFYSPLLITTSSRVLMAVRGGSHFGVGQIVIRGGEEAV